MSNAATHKEIVTTMLLGALLLGACDGVPTEPGASRIELLRGDSQEAIAGLVLPMPFEVRVLDGSGKGASNVKIDWQVVSGAGDFLTYPSQLAVSPSFTHTNADGLARVFFRPAVPGLTTVTASVAELEIPPVTFTTNAIEPPDVVIHFGPIFDCNEPSGFRGPENSSDVTVEVGAIVEWVYAEGGWLHPSCTARLVATSAPPGGELFDSGILHPGQGFRFVPGVAGTWAYTDVINGGGAGFTVTAP